MKLACEDCKYEQNIEDKNVDQCPRCGSHYIKIFLFGVAAKQIGRSAVYRRDQEKEIYCKRCKKDVVPVREDYNPKHTLGWLLGDSTMIRGVRCPNCNTKLYSKVENIIMKSSCIVLFIVISLFLIFTFI